MKKYTFVAAIFVATVASAAVQSAKVAYKEGKTDLEGVLYYPEVQTAQLPAVIVVHEWMGLNDYAKMRAEQVAGLGYVAFAADIYGKGVTANNADEAKKLSTLYKSDRALMRKRINAAFNKLKAIKLVDANRVAAIGYCFGGTTALELARSGADVKGVVSFHGGLDTPDPRDAQNIKGKVLVLTGADDPNVPEAQVSVFEQEMRQAGVDWQLVSYGNAVHGFTNPGGGNDNSKGYAYNEKADKRSWVTMKSFLEEVLK